MRVLLAIYEKRILEYTCRMSDKVFTFRSYKTFAGKIVGVLLLVNFLVLLYLTLAQTTPILPMPFEFNYSSVFATFIILIIFHSSLTSRREVLNILSNGSVEFEYPGKKKIVKTISRKTHPYYYLLIVPALFSDKLIFISKSVNGEFLMRVTLIIPKGDQAAVDAVSVALRSFKYKEIPSNDEELIKYVKKSFRPTTMRGK